MSKPMWMVRAGRGAGFVDEFIENSIVAIGWPALGEINNNISREQLVQMINEVYPDFNKGKRAISAGQVFRFLSEIKVGDWVLTYDSGRRCYLLGTIESDPAYQPELIEDLPRLRKVNWRSEIDRDQLSAPTKNTLGAISTLFLVSNDAASEIVAIAEGGGIQKVEIEAGEVSDELELDTVKDQSKELIKDKIIRLDPYELQDLVAGVLRAMGYKTRVSPPGADRGVDIVASPDGFGFEQPRIVVECKHRKNSAMGSNEIRSFLGGRHKDDKGLYVSTGGFTKEARYEAERANITVTLMDLNQLADAVVEHYEAMDTEIRTLLPLAKVYWPA